ncbi:MAG: CPBP family intramembrane glutamic endopeptidase [Christensenellales bacterium]
MKNMKRTGIFLVIAFVLTWGICLILYLNGGLYNPFASIALAACMLCPAVASIITRLITKEGFKNMYIKPRFRGNGGRYVLSWLLMPLLITLGATLYFLLCPAHFDPSMTAFAQTSGLDPSLMGMIFWAQIAQSVLLAPILNLIPALGEELGWRGYLLPKLAQRYSPANAALISGAIWGFWHAPMIAMGHNYGLDYAFFPWGGILAMIAFCILLSGIFSYITFRAKSAIPAALLHGSMNGFAAAPVMLLSAGISPSPFVGPLPVGIIGGSAIIIAGAISFFLITKLPHHKKEGTADGLPDLPENRAD